MSERPKEEGGYFRDRGKYYARVTIAKKKRRAVLLPNVKTDEEAASRSAFIADLVRMLREAGKLDEYIDVLLEQGAVRPDDKLAELRVQIEAIQQIAKNGRNAVSHATLEKWMQKPEDWKAIGPFLPQMPQLFFHDEIMLRAAAAKNMPAMEHRLQELAKIDNNENYRILQKLNLVEVESIQRVHMESKFTGTQGGVKPGTDDLVFDDNKNDVWVDELNSYQAKVSLCQKKSGRTM